MVTKIVNFFIHHCIDCVGRDRTKNGKGNGCIETRGEKDEKEASGAAASKVENTAITQYIRFISCDVLSSIKSGEKTAHSDKVLHAVRRFHNTVRNNFFFLT
jgi:hypothetical protein